MPDHAAWLKRRRDQLDAEIEKLLALGDDAYEEDAVLLWRKRYVGRDEGPDSAAGPDEEFTYAAVKVNGRWWLTGRVRVGMTWDDLVRFVIGRGKVTEMWIVSEWKRMF